MEKGFIIGAKSDNQSVTLEPGGQLELSGASLWRRDVSQTENSLT